RERGHRWEKLIVRRSFGAGFRNWKAIDWGTSSLLFRSPRRKNGMWLYTVPPEVLKWLARARCGALNTSDRLFRTGVTDSPVCPVCAHSPEDDYHVLIGCAGLHSPDLVSFFLSCWHRLCRSVPPPPNVWIEEHAFCLSLALLPLSLDPFLVCPDKHQ